MIYISILFNPSQPFLGSQAQELGSKDDILRYIVGLEEQRVGHKMSMVPNDAKLSMPRSQNVVECMRLLEAMLLCHCKDTQL